MANPFPPDFWGYVHRFGHQTKGLIAPLAYYTLHMPMGTILDLLKVWQISLRQTLLGWVHSLEATLPAIIFIRGVYVLLPEQNTTRKGRVYENAATLPCTRCTRCMRCTKCMRYTRYTRCTRYTDVRDVQNIRKV